MLPIALLRNYVILKSKVSDPMYEVFYTHQLYHVISLAVQLS